MRVLTIVSDLAPGGTQRVAQNFAQGYKEAGLHSAVFAYDAGGPREAPLHASGVDVFLGGRTPPERDQGLEQAIGWKPDVVHIHRTGHANPVTGGMLARLRTAPREGSAAPVGIVETNVFARVDHSPQGRLIDVHFQLSHWCLWKWARWSSRLSPRPIGVVLPNIVRTDDFGPVSAPDRAAFRAEHSIPSDAMLFGRIGSPITPKWSREMFDAFRAYAPHNTRAHLLLIGLPKEMIPLSESLPPDIRARVTRIDFLHGDAALRRAYGAMDVFLHTSQVGESFGMVFAESLLCGTPIITLSTPARDNSQLEVVGHEQGGLIAADVPGMVEAMRRLEDPALRARYASLGAASMIERFSPGVLIPRAIAVARLTTQGLPHEELSRRLAAIPGLVTQVPDAEIKGLLRRAMGRHSMKDLATLRLISHPIVYRLYQKLAHRA